MMIVGIDEVGRGCWAGPVVAGAVILSADFDATTLTAWKLRDSKLLNKRQREAADTGIRQLAIAIGIGWVDAAAIDRIGLTFAVKLAMEQALRQITSLYDEIIVDGSYNFLADNPKARALIRADASVPAVSAASIVAKVARDNYMAEVSAEYPDYGFEQHVGYGTALHRERLTLYGASQLHRRSFKPVRALL
jgi:ribonuclease HII